MPTRTRSLSKTLIAVTAASAPVLVLAPSAQAAPATPQLPRSPLGAQPVLPATPVATTPVATTPVATNPVATTPVRTNPISTRRILPTPSTSQLTMWVNVPQGVNVRSQPSNSGSIVGGHSMGTRLTGTMTSNGWLRTGENRFVAANNLTTTDPSGGGGGGGGGGQTVTQVVTADVGNVRSGPGLNHRVVGTLTRGTQVSGSWVNGWLDMGNGRFMSGTILANSSTPAPSPSPAPAPTPDPGATTVERWVSVPVANVRSGPSTSYNVVGTRTAGTSVSGQLTSNGWLRISSTQFMAPSVLTDVNPGSGGGGGAQEVTRYVSAAVANVRSGPSTSHSVVGTRTGGTEVRGTIHSSGWLQMANNQFMSPGVLTTTAPAPTPAPAPAPVPTPPQDTSPLRQAILDTAAQYVGYPYVLYGTPPNAFDCSSYTWYVYQQNGINIPRTVRDQKAMVTPVTDPQPGDLIFYDDFYHVGIYAGAGMTYEALNPNAGVRFGAPVSSRIWFGRVPGM
ncbi:NlpC/P60 family protein [Ornithinimicrobium sp. Y1694]|uniref:C40 family peptidase n=1 Tax=Ornithinimicrobium sp. Y1694 TaxID=3418590 RepID=UPI003CE80757